MKMQKDPYYSKKDTLPWHEASFQIIQVFVQKNIVNVLRTIIFIEVNKSILFNRLAVRATGVAG